MTSPETPQREEQRSQPFMSLGELLNRLRSYPALRSIMLATMTDEQWEEVVLGPITKEKIRPTDPADELMDEIGLPRSAKFDFEQALLDSLSDEALAQIAEWGLPEDQNPQ